MEKRRFIIAWSVKRDNERSVYRVGDGKSPHKALKKVMLNTFWDFAYCVEVDKDVAPEDIGKQMNDTGNIVAVRHKENGW